MAKNNLPLNEISIEQLYLSGEKTIYEIPIYQRNYAWEKDEISALVQDVYDAYLKNREKGSSRVYYIGTLVSYHKGDNVFEIIDGQQRLTTIRLILCALGYKPTNRLTYRARKKSDETIRNLPKISEDERDNGIVDGYRYAESAIKDIVGADLSGFTSYFLNNVHIIHYRVPKSIDLNHYFEVMNSRGEQLEKHEIVKAHLMEKLDTDDERKLFNLIWDSCSEMSVYIQQNLSVIKPEQVFGNSLFEFLPSSFDAMLPLLPKGEEALREDQFAFSILDMIEPKDSGILLTKLESEKERKDTFQPIIDFPNFLLIVLKLLLIKHTDFNPLDYILDDKELLNAFTSARLTTEDVKLFGYILLKSKFLLDNYVVHHSNEEDTFENNPWKLQCWIKEKKKEDGKEKARLKNLVSENEDNSYQKRLVHLLSMFEVSFTARQRKNYLFYCLMYLMDHDRSNYASYAAFVEDLAKRYFKMVYLDGGKLNAINTPMPGSFDESMLMGHELSNDALPDASEEKFVSVYGDGTEASRGIPLFIFNYLDYKLWKLYDSELRGESAKEESPIRRAFFEKLGCSDFGLKIFDQFYFSRTRRSLEHYYPQAEATGMDGRVSQSQINCFGNYAMIGSDANSSGSNWTPLTKLDHYLDASHKIRMISVASLKMMVMMQLCRDRQQWGFDEIKEHQKKMVELLIQ